MKCGVSTLNSDKYIMKKLFMLLFVFITLGFTLASCSKEDEGKLSEQDQKEVILAMFNAGNAGVNQGRNNPSQMPRNSAVMKSPDASNAGYPINYKGSYNYPDGKGGSINMTIELGGVINYNSDPYQCLGGFILIGVTETINHFRVELTNGREVYIDSRPSISFTGNFKILPGCETFSASESYLHMEGMYLCNGIEYDLMLNGFINTDGSCDRISGFVNGIPISFDY